MDIKWNTDRADQIISEFKSVKGGLLECFHALQNEFGFISDEVYSPLAKAFNLSRAEVFGVKSFYHDFRSETAGKKHIKICQAEACQAMGSRELTTKLEQTLDIKLGQTTPDGQYSLEAVYCLGNCACSPNVQVNGKLHARVDKDKLSTLLQGDQK